jgi:two-component system sensor histidine kinase KdpD
MSDFFMEFNKKSVTLTVGIMILVTLLAFLLRFIGFNESNIIIAYILGVLLVAKQTEGYLYGISASIMGVLTFNFFFTVPYYSLMAYRPDYPITFVIMLICSIITSTMTTKAKHETRLSVLREKRAQILYQFSKSLLKVRSITEIADVGVKDIAKLFNRSVIMAAINASDELGEPCIYANEDDERAIMFNSFLELQVLSEVFNTGNSMGTGMNDHGDRLAYYLAIKGQSGILGVVGVSCFDNKLLTVEQKTILEAVTAQIALAMERERLSEKQQRSKLEVERERLRGNLLRAISHDLRTPLTGILGATGTMLDHDDVLEKKVKMDLLQGVYEDASWLIHAVENILSITRMDEGKVELIKSMEAVEEVVAESISRIKKLAVNHIIRIKIPDELILVPMDGMLIGQVLVNLLDNAIKYTPDGSIIELNSHLDGEKLIFEIADNGNGISEVDLPLIFDRFYIASTLNHTGRRGTGLGLAICKSIISAHGGEISVFNNLSGGATLKFVLPVKE